MPRLQSRPAGAAVVVFGALMALQCSSRVTVDDPRPVVSVRELMENIFDPFGDTLFDAVGFDVTPTGVHDVRPETDEDWARLRQASVAIAEGTNLLKIHPRPLVPPDYAYSPEDRGPGAPELARQTFPVESTPIAAAGISMPTVCGQKRPRSSISSTRGTSARCSMRPKRLTEPASDVTSNTGIRATPRLPIFGDCDLPPGMLERRVGREEET